MKNTKQRTTFLGNRTAVPVRTFKGAAALITAAVLALLITACPNSAGGGGKGAEKVRVTLERTLGGNVEVSPALPADGKVKKGSSFTFTAKPLAGFNLEKWELNGQAVNGTALTYTLKADKESKVKVYFKNGGSGVTSFKVRLNAGANGKLSSDPPIPSDGMIPENTELTFKAEPDSGYEADKWQITGGAFEAGTGTAGNTTAKVKLTANITVSLSFKKSGGGSGEEPAYVKVPYAELETYLANTALSTKVNYIEVTGTIPADNFEGSGGSPSALGQKIKAHPAKKVALKLPATVPGLIDMSRCFYKCENLVSLANIPESVEYMSYCFFGCTGLAQAPVIPQGVIGMISSFENCTGLKKAPALPKNGYLKRCFANCTNLTEAPHIPEGVEGMPMAFLNCTSLTQAPDIPASVKDMRRCFAGCSKLKKVTLNAQYISRDFDGEKAFKGLFENCTDLEEGGVQVPAAFLGNYTSAEALNVMAVPPAGNPAEQKKKFAISPNAKYTVKFGVYGANGALTATVDGTAISSGAQVKNGKTVLFTAAPASGYRVKGWTLDGTAVNGKNGTYPLTVSKPAEVKVSFESNSVPLPKYTVKFGVDGLESSLKTLKATVDGTAISSGTEVEEGKTVLFTANPAAGYRIRSWTISGGTFEEGTGTAENPIAKVKVTRPLIVRVRTKRADSISPVQLDIEGTVLKGYKGDKPAGKLRVPAGITEIADNAFKGCTDITQVYLPENFTKIGNSAFADCQGMERVILGKKLTHIGDLAFYRCSSLKACSHSLPIIALRRFEFPASLAYLGQAAFLECADVAVVDFRLCKNPPLTAIGQEAFDISTGTFKHFKVKTGSGIKELLTASGVPAGKIDEED